MATHLGADGIDGLHGIVVLGDAASPRPAREASGQSSDGLQLRFHRPRRARRVRRALGARPYVKTIDVPVTLHAIAGADHLLERQGKARSGGVESMLTVVADWIADASRSVGTGLNAGDSSAPALVTMTLPLSPRVTPRAHLATTFVPRSFASLALRLLRWRPHKPPCPRARLRRSRRRVRRRPPRPLPSPRLSAPLAASAAPLP